LAKLKRVTMFRRMPFLLTGLSFLSPVRNPLTSATVTSAIFPGTAVVNFRRLFRELET
jgi:hypothetical protein